MFGPHPWATEDWILPIGIVAAASGHFYTAAGLLLLYGWLNKRSAIRYREEQERARADQDSAGPDSR